MLHALQSKAILPAKLWLINNYYYDMVIFDIAFKLNPVISLLPYNSPKKIWEDAYKDLLFSQPDFHGLNNYIDDNIDDWNYSFKKSKSMTTKSGTSVSPDDISIYINPETLGVAKFLSVTFSETEETLSIPFIHQALDKNVSQTQFRAIHNKLASLRDIEIILKNQPTPYKTIFMKSHMSNTKAKTLKL